MAAPLPLAAGLDWLEGLLPVLFVLFWIVSQVWNLFAGARKAAGRGAVRPEPQDDEARREMARRIEEFMRRTAEERPARVQEPSRPLESEVERRRRNDATSRSRRPRSRPAPPRTPAPEPRAPQVVPPPRSLGSLGGHGTDVARHVADAFAQEIPHLATPAAGAAAPAPAAAPGIAALLRSPATLRHLVLVHEVLERPVHRW